MSLLPTSLLLVVASEGLQPFGVVRASSSGLSHGLLPLEVVHNRHPAIWKRRHAAPVLQEEDAKLVTWRSLDDNTKELINFSLAQRNRERVLAGEPKYADVTAMVNAYAEFEGNDKGYNVDQVGSCHLNLSLIANPEHASGPKSIRQAWARMFFVTVRGCGHTIPPTKAAHGRRCCSNERPTNNCDVRPRSCTDHRPRDSTGQWRGVTYLYLP